MAAQLWLLRHAEAVPHDAQPDAERRLTDRGERQALAAGAGLATLGVDFAACYTSPKVRALDTARLACRALGVEPQTEQALADGFDRGAAFELLVAHDDDARVLAVGHNPSFEQVVHDLTGARVDFKKGGVAVVRMHRTTPELMLLLRPRELESLAAR